MVARAVMAATHRYGGGPPTRLRGSGAKDRPVHSAAMATEILPAPSPVATPAPRPRIFSGIQPSGVPHIGNDLGAIRNYVKLQWEYEAIYCIVDYHALTSLHDADRLRRQTHEMAAGLLALGLDPERCTLFVQSHRPEVTELAWLLTTVTPVTLLSRFISGTNRLGLLQAGLAPLARQVSGIRILAAPFDATPVVNALWWHPVHSRDPEHAWMRSIFEEAARSLDIPILFVFQWHDELMTRESGLALFDAIGSQEKTMHVNPGGHVQMPLFEREAAEAFFVRHLGTAKG